MGRMGSKMSDVKVTDHDGNVRVFKNATAEEDSERVCVWNCEVTRLT